MRTRTIEIDLSSNSKSFKTLKYKQFDHNNLLEVIVKDNRKLVDLTSHTISVFFLLPDGQVIQRNVSFKDGKIPVLLENIVLRLSGKVLVEINLLKDEQIVTSFTIYLDVEKSIDRNSAVEGDPVWDILKDASEIIENVKDVTDEIRVDMDIINKDMQNAKTDINNIKSDLPPLKTDVSVAKTDISNIKSDLSPLKTDVSVAKTDISNIKTNINTAKTDVNEINTNIENVQKDMNTINSNISSAQNNIGVIISDVTKINKDLVDIGNNIDTTEENIDEINSTLNKIRTDADTVISDINKVNTDIDTIEGNINNINEELNEINTNIEFVNNVNEEFEKLDKLETKEIGIIEIAQKNTKVENTANGYFSNVKVEGKTLVNVVNKPKNGIMTIEQELGNGNWVNTTENSLITPSVKGKTLVNCLVSEPDINIPSGSQSYYEDGYVYFIPSTSPESFGFGFNFVKPNTIYTLCFNIISLTDSFILKTDLYPDTYANLGEYTSTGFKCITFTTPSDITTLKYFRLYVNSGTTETCKVSRPMLFEGDLTQTPELIPTEYVEGLKSSFEDGYIPEEGKYKVVYKTVGKNLYNEYNTSIKLRKGVVYTTNFVRYSSDKGVYFTIVNSDGSPYNSGFSFMEGAFPIYSRPEWLAPRGNYEIYSSVSFAVNEDCYLVRIFNAKPNSFQLEEGTTSTEYEPYKEDALTLYLNSPLLEGDEIKVVDGKLGHYHKMGKVVFEGVRYIPWNIGQNAIGKYRWVLTNSDNVPFKIAGKCYSDRYPYASPESIWRGTAEGLCINSVANSNGISDMLLYLERYSDGSDASKSALIAELQANPTTVVYELASPYFEPLTDDIQFIQAYENGHLQIDSMVPVIDVKTEPLYIYPYYLNASTEYLVQFYANREGEVIVTLDTTNQTVQVQSGINKIYLTTSSNVDPILKLSGDNIKIKDIMIVEKTDNEIEYFEGIKSIGEYVDDMSITTYKTPMRFGKGGRL